MIKAIIFDYYGVITTDQFFLWLHHHPEIGAHHAEALKHLNQDQDKGIDRAEYVNRLADIAGVPVGQLEHELHTHVIMHEPLLEFIVELRRAGLKTAILSNSSVELYQIIAEHQIDGLFDQILCSGEAGVVKPDPKIYQMILTRLKVEPTDAMLVDDRDYNLDGAAKIDMETHLYSGLTKLKVDLANREVYP